MNDLISKIFNFNKKPVTKLDYQLVERQINPELIVSGVKVTSGPLAGLIFTTSPTVSFKEDISGEVKLKYEYVIQIPPKDPVFRDNIELIERTVGDIILDIIEKNYSDANRESDFECNGEGHRVRQESTPAP